MAKNPKFLKNLLTTASALTIITGSATSALGAAITTGGNEQLSNAGTWNPAAPVDGDTIVMRAGNADNIDANRANAIIAAIRTTGNAGSVLTINESLSIGAIGNAAVAGKAIGITFGGAKTLTLTGTVGQGGDPAVDNYLGLGDIDFNNAAGVLTIQANSGNAVTLAGAFINAGNVAAVLNVNTDLIATDAANAGKTILSVKTINITDNKTLTVAPNGNVAVTISGDVRFAGKASKLVLDAVNAGAAATFTINGGSIGGAAGGGVVVLNANGNNLTLAKNAAETLGVNNAAGRLTELQITGANNINVNVVTFAKKITVGVGANPLTFGAAVDSGAGSVLKLTGARDIAFNDNATIETIDFNNQASTITVADTKKLTANLVGDVANAGNTVGILDFAGDGELAGTATRLAKINLGAAGKIVKLAGVHTVTEIQGLGAGTAQLADGFKLTGDINSTGGNAVVLDFKGDGIVTGTIGNGAAVGLIQINAADKLVDLQGNTKAAGIKFIAAGKAQIGDDFTGDVIFTTDGTLLVTNDAAHTITGNITTALAAGGTIDLSAVKTAANVVEIVGDLGAAANSAKLIIATGGGSLKLSGANNFVKTIDITGANTVIEFSKAGANNVFALTNNENQGILKISEDTIFGDANTSVTFAKTLNQVVFTDNKTLTVEAKGINLNAANGIINTAKNNGAFVFNGGTNFIDATIGTELQPFNALNLANANTSVELKKAAYFNGAITFNDATQKLIINDALQAADIAGGAPNQGTVTFNNAGTTPLVYKGTIGNANAVKAIEIAGGDVTLTNIVKAQNLTFTTDTAANLILSQGITGPVVVTTASTKANQNIQIAADTILGVGTTIGAKDKVFGNIVIDQDKTLTVQIGDKLFAGVTTTVDAKGKVIFNTAAAPTISRLGTSDKGLGSVTFDIDSTVSSDIYARAITINDGKTVKFAGTIAGGNKNAGKITLGNAADATAEFADGAILGSTVDANADGKSIVNFTGGATINSTLGATKTLAEVNFKGVDKVVNLGKDIKAVAINLGKNTYNTTASTTLTGKATAAAASTVFNVNSGDLTFADGPAAFTGATFILSGGNLETDNATFTGPTVFTLGTNNVALEGDTNLSGATTITTTYQNASTVGTVSAGKLIAANGSTLAVQVDDKSNDFLTSSQQVTLVTAGSFEVANLAVSFKDLGSNRFVNWTFDGKKILTRSDNSAEAITQIVASNAVKDDADLKANVQTILSAGNTGAYRAEAIGLANLGDGDKTLIESIQKVSTQTSDATTTALTEEAKAITDGISNRIAAVTAPEKLLAQNGAGVAAGEDDQRHGAWVAPFYGRATQKMRKGVSGFKSQSTGGTFGFDTMANDTMTVGIAATVVGTSLKHKDVVAGGKTKANTAMFSVYGLQQVADNWFVQGIASFGSSKVKTNTNRIGYNTTTRTATNEVANGKYDTLSYGGELLAGYNYKLSEEVAITPMIGIDYTRFNDSGYRETGTVAQNRSISKKSTDKFEAILGARVAMATEANGVALTPELHGFVRQALSNKNPKLDVRLDGMTNPLAVKTVKAAKTFYNVGFGVNSKVGAMEYGAGYDAHLANKYVGHQGTLKIRVNF